jgi:hypothetical protein
MPVFLFYRKETSPPHQKKIFPLREFNKQEYHPRSIGVSNLRCRISLFIFRASKKNRSRNTSSNHAILIALLARYNVLASLLETVKQSSRSLLIFYFILESVKEYLTIKRNNLSRSLW